MAVCVNVSVGYGSCGVLILRHGLLVLRWSTLLIIHVTRCPIFPRVLIFMAFQRRLWIGTLVPRGILHHLHICLFIRSYIMPAPCGRHL